VHKLPLVAPMPQWRQDYPDDRPPTWATAISAVGQNPTNAPQQTAPWFEVRLPIKRQGITDETLMGPCRAGQATARAERTRFRKLHTLMGLLRLRDPKKASPLCDQL
jgi:hypothetical protein